MSERIHERSGALERMNYWCELIRATLDEQIAQHSDLLVILPDVTISIFEGSEASGDRFWRRGRRDEDGGAGKILFHCREHQPHCAYAWKNDRWRLRNMQSCFAQRKRRKVTQSSPWLGWHTVPVPLKTMDCGFDAIVFSCFTYCMLDYIHTPWAFTGPH